MKVNTSVIQERLMKISRTLKANKYLNSISEGLISLFPILMIGAIFTIFKSFPYEPYVNFMKETGLMEFVSIPVQLTTNMIAVYAAFAVSYKLAEHFEKDSMTAGILSLVSFFILTPLTVDEAGAAAISFSWTGAGGLFGAFIIAILVTRLFVFITDKNLVIKMPEGVPPTTVKAFLGLIPMFVTMVVVLLVRFIFSVTYFESIHNFVYQILQIPLSNLGNTFLVFLFLKVLGNVFWLFGIHGGLVMYAIAVPLWLSMDYANLAAYGAQEKLPYILGYAFGMIYAQFCGTGNTIGLNIAMLKAKSKRYRMLGKLALPASICGVNEPLIFGTPIILNPILAIPFLLNPIVSLLLAYVCTVAGILPRLNGIFMFGLPIGVSGFVSGGWRVAVFQLILCVISYFMYFPFFKIIDEQSYKEECMADGGEK